MDESRVRKRTLDNSSSRASKSCLGASECIAGAADREFLGEALTSPGIEHGEHQSPTAAAEKCYDRGDTFNVDNLVGQICNRLSSLERITNEETVAQGSNSSSGHSSGCGSGYREARIAVFMDVMQCSRQEALFYVDSAAGDVAVAVSLYVEQQPDTSDSSGIQRHKVPRSLFANYSLDSTRTMHIDRSGGHIPRAPAPGPKHMYRRREVVIQGLPPGWDAYVSAHTGCIVFRHIESQVRQFQVPPGFADFIDASVEPDASPFQSKRQRMQGTEEGLNSLTDSSVAGMFEGQDGAIRQASAQNTSSISPRSSTESASQGQI
jgi:hypothetical protein